MGFLEAGLVEDPLEEVQVVVAVSVVYQLTRQEVEVGQHPSHCLVEDVGPVLDEQCLARWVNIHLIVWSRM